MERITSQTEEVNRLAAKLNAISWDFKNPNCNIWANDLGIAEAKLYELKQNRPIDPHAPKHTDIPRRLYYDR